MSTMKTLISGALIVLGMTGVARAGDDLVLVFAGCAGRISAEMEQAWLFSDPRADVLHAQRQRFVSILDAIMPPERARAVLNHRVETKLAHAAMLTTSRFGTDPRLSELATQRARMQVQACQTMLLDG